MQAQQQFSFSPSPAGMHSRAQQLAAERSQSWSIQPGAKPPSSHPFLISTGALYLLDTASKSITYSALCVLCPALDA